jgi:hypothetical protein
MFFPLQKGLDNERTDWNRFLRRFGFARTDNTTDNRPRDGNQTIGEVDIAPL